MCEIVVDVLRSGGTHMSVIQFAMNSSAAEASLCLAKVYYGSVPILQKRRRAKAKQCTMGNLVGICIDVYVIVQRLYGKVTLWQNPNSAS
jgi:hypothetical protein